MNDKTKLTLELLAQGYTKDNHPDYVSWHYNGFEYNWSFYQKSVWQTKCGWFVKNLGYCGHGHVNGVDYRPENNNHLIHCLRPDKALICPHMILEKIGRYTSYLCPVHLTDKPYDYQRSREKVEDDGEEMSRLTLERLKERYPRIHSCVCRHLDSSNRWYIRYDPNECINYTDRGCFQEVCAITGKPRNLKRANLYYDVRTFEYKQQGFLEWCDVRVLKGKKWFNSKKAISDIEAWLKVNPAVIQKYETGQHTRNNGLPGINTKFAVVENIRIESRPSRDLRQDLADIAEGIAVNHQSDLKKAAAAHKRERRASSREKRDGRLERMVFEVGYNNMDEANQRRADKWLGRARIVQLEQKRETAGLENPVEDKPSQLSLFD